MNTKPQTKFKLILISFFASFFAIVFSFYFLHEIVIKVRDSKIKIAEVKRDTALLDKISQEKKQYSNDIQKITSTLPSEYYEVSFFTTQLEQLAQNNNLILEINIDKSKKEEKGSFSSIEYALDIEGSYPSISEFLSQISKLSYHTSIDQLKIFSEEGILTANVKFKLFVEK